MNQSTLSQPTRSPTGRSLGAFLLVLATSACLMADEPHPTNTPDPIADRHGDTFEGVKIVVEEEKFDSGVTSTYVEGIRSADGKFTRHGWTITYYESGHKRTKTLWRNGVPDGERLTWYKHGQLWSRGFFTQGIEDGLWQRWHENGEQFSEWTMRRGTWHGIYSEWHPNGKKRTEVEFVDGLRQGPMNMYDDQGVLIAKTDYADGVEQP